MKKKVAILGLLTMVLSLVTQIVPAYAFEFILPDIVLPPLVLTNTIYVNDIIGDDLDSGLTPNLPVRTITKAIDIANSSTGLTAEILISEGDYTAETFPLEISSKAISMYGGYNSSFSEQDPNTFLTEVKGGSDTMISIINQNSTISGMKLYSQSAGNATIDVNYLGTGDNTVTINGVEIADVLSTFGGLYVNVETGDTVTISSNYLHGIASIGATVNISGDGDSTFNQNLLFDNGGGIPGALAVDNTLIYNNIISSTSGGAALKLGDGSEAYYNTIVNNLTGVSVDANASVIIESNLIAYNSGTALNTNTGSTVSNDYNAYFTNGTQPTFATNELDCDPGLSNINSSNPGGYELSPTSDCIDEGNENSNVDSDYYGEERQKDGNNDAFYASDPGAFESPGDTAIAPVITNFSASPNVFSPDGDGTNDTLTITLDTNTTANVIVAIYDANSDLVVQLLNEVRGSGTHNIVWDGKDTGGVVADDGSFSFTITVDNNLGTDEETGDVSIDMGATEPPPDPSALCAGFTDVSISHPLCPAIEYVAGEGIFEGYPDGTFQVDRVINRAETTKVILVGFEVPLLPDDGTKQGFSDVIIGEWYMTYLRTAKAADIVEGYEDGTFQPNRQVNRVEMLKIFLETSDEDIASIILTDDPYPDTPLTEWYASYVQFSKDNSLLDLDTLGNFNPATGMERGDVAELFLRYSQL